MNFNRQNIFQATSAKTAVWDAGLRLHYTLQSFTNQDQINWNKTFWVNSDINVKLTENWKMTYSSRFDLVENKIINHSLYLFRPLHCWEFSFKWWPEFCI